MSQDVKIAPRSSWVKDLEADLNAEPYKEGGAVKYLLIDYQDHVDKEEAYVHIIYQVLNDEGVQNYSNVSIDYDPSYQELIFHEVSVYRDGKRINKLKRADISTIRREDDMNRHLYDGSLTSYMNLTDVRSDDIIEYSYTRVGFNPVFEGNYSSSFYQDFSVPVEDISVRVVSSKKLYSEETNEGVLPVQDGDQYYVKVKPNLIVYENNTPGWYFPFRLISLSTFSSWSEVVQWATPLYSVEKGKIQELSQALENEFLGAGEKNERILEAIRFVQDDIRYLGFESGIQGYKPSSPDLVLDRRFGDCKDKSNLLVGILSGIGVEAYPMLVHSSKEHMIDLEQPSPAAFDHCVVNFRLDEKDYYVDPTINNQGGGLDVMQFPNYKRGLVIKNGETALRNLGETSVSKQRVKETITVKDLLLGGNAELKVELPILVEVPM